MYPLAFHNFKVHFLKQKFLFYIKISIMENFQNEKQIMVDPHSLRNSPIKQVYNQETKKLPTIITTPPTNLLHPPTLQPPKLRFLSLSLPNSVNSSPRFDSVKNRNLGARNHNVENLLLM
jgi:hypothetical protein